MGSPDRVGSSGSQHTAAERRYAPGNTGLGTGLRPRPKRRAIDKPSTRRWPRDSRKQSPEFPARSSAAACNELAAGFRLAPRGTEACVDRCPNEGADWRTGRELEVSNVVMDAESVIDRMLQCIAGQIVGCNIVAGVDNSLIGKGFAKDALEWLGRLAAFDSKYGEPGELVKALRVLWDGVYPPGMSLPASPPEFALRDRIGMDARDRTGAVSCVVPAGLLNRLISPFDMDRFRGEGLIFPSLSSEPRATDAVKRWRRKTPSERRVRFNPDETLVRPRSVVWFTRRRDLTAALGRRDMGNHAQRARDWLGLVHHGRGVVLAALHFPAQLLRTRASARPTFMDAADHLRFRAWPDGRRARSNRAWGYTVDLGALDRSEPSMDGAPERITRDIPGNELPEDGRFEFDLLGAVEEALGVGPDADEVYAERLLGGMSVADLGFRLRSYL